MVDGAIIILFRSDQIENKEYNTAMFQDILRLKTLLSQAGLRLENVFIFVFRKNIFLFRKRKNNCESLFLKNFSVFL